MSWNTYSIEDRKLTVISGLAIVLIIVSLYIQSKLVLFLSVFILTVLCCNQFYLKRVGKQLFFENITEKHRYFVNDKGQWTITIRNEGYPILNAKLKIYFDQCVIPEGETLEPNLSLNEISLRFSIFARQTKQIIVPFSANGRGIAQIHKLEFRIPSLLGFGETVLESKWYLNQLAVVYPEPIPVKGLKEQLSVHQGIYSAPSSYYEDRLGPTGTRDYISSDSFNRIHWKASARKQELQTMIYEKISEKGWMIALNISDGHSITGNLEKLLSSITEMAYFAYKNQIPFSLCINVRTAGSTPFLYLPKGEGKEHLQTVLETIASINSQNISLPYEQMLSFYSKHLEYQPIFIHAGIRRDDTNRLLLNLSNKGGKLFNLKIEEDHGLLSELDIHHERRALLC
ncbi:DUF58 domain-containing protein [Neobacillus sp. MM2021_6]|uniref:DUF58 domain-containing protein n=1 Tax=Bacillaceae TaxID=186817 RepID=UPI00140E8447|nr:MULTISPECIES: DUF58 domain-containing protein [Bacillaceae]MBO0960369.1 DUF58 domain-containing protein [Neobacillus sp. MM2021_6]NHC16774.1 DUF58 domain-containing protein [Bacillus sp. MM2020_4]